MLSGSTTAAAGILNTSQPNVSRSIALLERSTGLRLFERSPGKVVPTNDGISFFNEVQRSFVGLQRLEDAAKRIRRFSGGFLRVAAIPTLALGLIPRTIKRFAQLYPEASFSIHTGHSSAVSQWVDEHSCDLGIVSRLNENYGFESEELYQTDGVCMMPRDHRLEANPCIGPADLAGESYISFPQNEDARSAVDEIFEQAGISRRITLETPYSSITCSLVAQGLGIAIVNPIVAHDYRHMGIVTRPFLPKVGYTATLIYPKGRPESRLVSSFVETLKLVTREDLLALATSPEALIAGADRRSVSAASSSAHHPARPIRE